MNKVVLFLVCFFFGVLGVHRFVVGRFLSGLLYLFTAGLFGIGVIVDLVCIVLGTFPGSRIK